jgi:hypothetical protein
MLQGRWLREISARLLEVDLTDRIAEVAIRRCYVRPQRGCLDNPDHVAIVIHSYRWRLSLTEGESKYDDLEKKIAMSPVITVPTISMEGDANGAPHYPDDTTYREKFSGKYEYRVIKGGIGHKLPQDAPQALPKRLSIFLGPDPSNIRL